MTTDVTNVQNAAQMILRMAVRAPLMLICSMVMCFFISAKLSMIFLVAILVLAAALISIMVRTTKVFNEVFRKYDDLNASVQENVSAIRVVKAFVREEYENSKFDRAAGKLYTPVRQSRKQPGPEQPGDDAGGLWLYFGYFLVWRPFYRGRQPNHRKFDLPVQLCDERADVVDDALHDLCDDYHERRQRQAYCRGFE